MHNILNPAQMDSYASVTGKSVTLHGIEVRNEAVGLGLTDAVVEAFTSEKVSKLLKLSPGLKGKTLAIQGFERPCRTAAVSR